MTHFKITDWDDAYENGGHIVGADAIIKSWPEAAAAYRAKAYCTLDNDCGDALSSRYDLFMPDTKPKGLAVFIHGGYWQKTDKSMWSHLAQGCVEAGWAVAIVGYDLCPYVSIATIEKMVGTAINHAARTIDGPIVITGHSAGGHLTAAMACADTPLEKNTIARLAHIMPISGVFDLRPLINTKLNDALKLDWDSATAVSTALKKPLENIRLTGWVGGAERSEFLRQNRMFTDMWRGLGAATQTIEEPDKNHFNVIDGLTNPHSLIVHKLLDI